MPLYEHVFLARQDLAQAQVDAIAENATKIITDNGGQGRQDRDLGPEVASPTGSPRTARRITSCSTSTHPPAAIAELERQSNINEDVIRFLTIRVDAHEKGPSAMMRRANGPRSRRRGDRGDRDRATAGSRRPHRISRPP